MIRATSSLLPPDLCTGIVHLGLGAFHRAHQAAFTQDAIMAQGGDWGIEAVAMRNPVLANALNAQKGVFSLIERHPDGPQPYRISAIRHAHVLPGRVARVAARLADPAIHLVTITVTEKGYGADMVHRCLNRGDVTVARDLAHPDDPRGLVGLIVSGLSKRRAAGGTGLTILSCDNLADNGRLLKGLVRDFARSLDAELAAWISDMCRFPNSMVDRITPAPTPETQALARRLLGKPDPVAVEAEPFRQWVIEDDFAGPRPVWEAAGALIVPDVGPFEAMKLRMLNGCHSLIAYAGAVSGLNTVSEVIADPRLKRVVELHLTAAAGTLKSSSGLDPARYATELIARFANPAIVHKCAQIAMDGSQKMPQRIFAGAREGLAGGEAITTFALATAFWLRYVETAPELDDPMAASLRTAVRDAAGDARILVASLGNIDGLATFGLFAADIWVDAVTKWLEALRAYGLNCDLPH